MATFYFRHGQEDENCYHLSYWKRYLEEYDLDSMQLVKAEREIGSDAFYCQHYEEVGLKEDSGCGTLCDGYSPRNGKNGRCRHSANCYTPTDTVITIYRKKKKQPV